MVRAHQAMESDNVRYIPSRCLTNVSALLEQAPGLPLLRPERANRQLGLIREWAQSWNWCALPAAGTFVGGLRDDEPPARACEAPLQNGEGAWTSDNSWVPHECAADGRTVVLSRASLLRCVAGRVVLFEGDSFTRQLFLRLIWWLRGSPVVVEHYFHRDGAYEFDEQKDEFEIVSSEFKKSPSDWRPHRDHYFENNRSRLLQRLETALEQPRRRVATFLFRVYGRGDMYSRFAASPRLLAGIRGRFTQFELRVARKGIDSLSLDVMNGYNHTLSIAEASRNGSLGRWPRNSLRVGAWPTLRNGSISSDGSATDVHTQCTFGPIYPSSVLGFKWPANGDCRDILGLNAVRAMLSRACAADRELSGAQEQSHNSGR